jgi:hypothetical protein
MDVSNKLTFGGSVNPSKFNDQSQVATDLYKRLHANDLVAPQYPSNVSNLFTDTTAYVTKLHNYTTGAPASALRQCSAPTNRLNNDFPFAVGKLMMVNMEFKNRGTHGIFLNDLIKMSVAPLEILAWSPSHHLVGCHEGSTS